MEEIMLRNPEIPAFVNKDLAKATKEISALGDKIKESYFKVAAKIAAVDASECYKEDGFSSVHEWTETVWGWKKTRSYELLNIGREWTSTVLDSKGKIVGYCSNIAPGYSTSQIAAMIPGGHALAADLDADGEITPSMSVKKIKEVISAHTKGDETEEAAEIEDTEEAAETEDTEIPRIRVMDTHGNAYEVPADILEHHVDVPRIKVLDTQGRAYVVPVGILAENKA